MSQMSTEVADEVMRYSIPVIAGLFTTLGGMIFVETKTDWADDYRGQQQLGYKINQLDTEINTLESASEMIGYNGKLVNQINVRQETVSELQIQRDMLGNGMSNGIEAYGLTIALGFSIAAAGIIRAKKKSN